MKVFITGNICTGKTTVGKKLASVMGAKFIEIDDFRRKNNKQRTQDGEDRARELFYRAISGNGPMVIGLTGTGKIFQDAKNHCGEHIIIHLSCSKDLIEKRIKRRCGVFSRYNHPPFPSDWKGFTHQKEDLLKFSVWARSQPNEFHHKIIVTNKTVNEIIKDIVCNVL